MILIESIKNEISKLSWSQIFMWVSYVVVPALGWFFSKAVQTMPEPTTGDSKKYIWLYRLLQEIGANSYHAQNAKEVLASKNFTIEMDKKDEENKKVDEDTKKGS